MSKPKNKFSFEYCPHLNEVLDLKNYNSEKIITIMKATSNSFTTTMMSPTSSNFIIQEPDNVKTKK